MAETTITTVSGALLKIEEGDDLLWHISYERESSSGAMISTFQSREEALEVAESLMRLIERGEQIRDIIVSKMPYFFRAWLESGKAEIKVICLKSELRCHVWCADGAIEKGVLKEAVNLTRLLKAFCHRKQRPWVATFRDYDRFSTMALLR